jgi:hypothetical protein
MLILGPATTAAIIGVLLIVSGVRIMKEYQHRRHLALAPHAPPVHVEKQTSPLGEPL